MDNCSNINLGTKYLAADIGLKIRLPYKDKQDLGVRIARDPQTGKETYEKPENVREKKDGYTGRITYVRK